MLLPINKTTSATKYCSFTENRKLQARCQFSKMVGTLTYCLWFFNLMYWYIINTQYNILCCTPVCFLSENSMSVSKHVMSNIVHFPIVNDVNLQYDVYSQQYLTNQRFVIDFIIKLLTILSYPLQVKSVTPVRHTHGSFQLRWGKFFRSGYKKNAVLLDRECKDTNKQLINKNKL